jgi:hypothetical protein
MPIWKVLFIVVLALVCFALASAAVVFPMTDTAGKDRWLWLAGLLAATAVMGSLTALFLRRAGASMR